MVLHCPECDSPLVLKQNEKGDNYYGCSAEGCSGNVWCHPGTVNPMGIPAVAKVRYLRYRCHRRFDRMWKECYYTRDKAYQWLAAWFKLPEDKAHIGMFDEEQCLRLLQLLEDFYASRAPKKVMRKSRQHKRAASIKRRRTEPENEEPTEGE